MIQSVLEADLLIIDDLGTETVNSLKLSELFTIINSRILNLNNHITKTIISTNLNMNDIFLFIKIELVLGLLVIMIFIISLVKI